MDPLHILIADDHSVVRRGIRQILLDEFQQARVYEVADAEDLVKRALLDDWDMIITDISMPGRSGLDAVSQIKAEKPKMPLLVLSIHPEDQYALRAFKAGASGYLSKDSAPEELIKAVRKLLDGKKYITPIVADRLANSLDSDAPKMPHELLSDREFDIMRQLAVGKSVSEIAELLALSVTTVSTYRSRILTKMTARTNAEITRYAIENQLL